MDECFRRDVAFGWGTQVAGICASNRWERERIRGGWNDTKRDYPADVCLHNLLEAQVRRTPNAAALVFNGQVF